MAVVALVLLVVIGLVAIINAASHQSSTFSQQPGTNPFPMAISCGTPSSCVVAGSLTNSGYSVGGVLNGVSCWTPVDCVAVGKANDAPWALVTTDGGSTWSDQSAGIPEAIETVAGAALNTVSCVPAACYAGADNGAMIKSTDGGASWQAVPSAGGMSSVSSISCPTSLMCVVAGAGTIITTDDGGAAWRSNTGAVASVSCPNATVCVAVGGTAAGGPEILTSSDGGMTWAEPAWLPRSTTELSAVSCTSAGLCVAVGPSAPFTGVYAGSGIAVSWRMDSPVSSVHTTVVQSPVIDGVECSGLEDCVAVGVIADSSGGNESGRSLRSADGGRSWSIVALPSLGTDSESCTPAGGGACFSDGGASVAVTRDGGHTWRAKTVDPSS